MQSNIKKQWFIFFTKREYPERLEKIKYKLSQKQYKNMLIMFESDDYETIRLTREIIISYERNDPAD